MRQVPSTKHQVHTKSIRLRFGSISMVSARSRLALPSRPLNARRHDHKNRQYPDMEQRPQDAHIKVVVERPETDIIWFDIYMHDLGSTLSLP